MTTLGVVTRSTLVRLGMRAISGNGARFELVVDASNIEELKEAVADTRPDVIVVDSPSTDDPVEACRMAMKSGAAVIVLAPFPDEVLLRNTLEAGVRGFLLNDATPEDLLTALDRIGSGDAVLDHRVTGQVIDWATGTHNGHDALSDREIEVLRLVANGASNKQVARRLDVSENTVKMYLRRAYRKLGCETRAEAAAEMVKRGLV